MNDKTTPASGNRPYAIPVIQEFGSIREITQSKNPNGAQDSAGQAAGQRTHA